MIRGECERDECEMGRKLQKTQNYGGKKEGQADKAMRGRRGGKRKDEETQVWEIVFLKVSQ